MGDLRRFVETQTPVYDRVLAELRAGRKRSHWMWFVFPQLKALGRSSMAQFYGLHDLDEVKSYWDHAMLGPRLAQCVHAALSVQTRTAHEIFGSPDDLKFCSCLSPFELASADPRFGEALDRFYDGRRDELTRTLVRP